MKTRFILAADIGGTNSRFALFRLDEESAAAPGVSRGEARLSLVPESGVCLPTAAQASFAQLLENLRNWKTPGSFSLLGDFELAALSLAVPGAVSHQGGDQICRAPNIAWPLRASEADRAGGAPAELLNDFAAQGLACLAPEALGLRALLPGEPAPAAPTVIIGAGTGLGKAIILPATPAPGDQAKARPTSWQAEPNAPAATSIRLPGRGRRESDRRLVSRVLPSEGGHSLFSFSGPEEADFQAFLLAKTGRGQAIGDMVVTGSGLAALYAYHAGLESFPPPPEVSKRLAREPETRAKVLDWLARFYGRACRNLVLETLALGGVYLSGGMLSHVPGLLGHPSFEAEFRYSETHALTLQNVPVWWVSNPASGLWGAALHGVNMLFGQE